MKKVLFFLFISSSLYSQNIYSVDYPYQSDVKVFVVDQEYKTDLKIFFVDQQYKAGWKNNSKKYLFY